MNFLIPIRKVDEEKRLVIGRAAQEIRDKSGEIMDYETAKPAFQAWSKSFEEATGGLSKGNLRVMHGKIAAGKIVDIAFNDEEKAIDVVAKVVDDNEWKKVIEGVYTGFSVGGKYAKKWADSNDKSLKRYTPEVGELSLVDSPCIPTARIFELHKMDGSVQQVEFQTARLVDDLDDVLAKFDVAPETIGKMVMQKLDGLDEAKVARVMHEFKEGQLKSSSGETVTDRKQAIAIALSEGRREEEKEEEGEKKEETAKVALFADLFKAEFDDSKHPRDEKGRFTATAGVATAGFIGSKAGRIAGGMAGAAVGARAARRFMRNQKVRIKPSQALRARLTAEMKIKNRSAPPGYAERAANATVAAMRRTLRDRLVRDPLVGRGTRIGSIVGGIIGGAASIYGSYRLLGQKKKAEKVLLFADLMKADRPVDRDRDGKVYDGTPREMAAPSQPSREEHKERQQRDPEYRAKTTDVIIEQRGGPIGYVAGGIAGAGLGAAAFASPFIRPSPNAIENRILRNVVAWGGRAAGNAAGRVLGVVMEQIGQGAARAVGAKGTAQRIASRGLADAMGRAGGRIGATVGRAVTYAYQRASDEAVSIGTRALGRKKAIALAGAIGAYYGFAPGSRAGQWIGEMVQTFYPREVEKLAKAEWDESEHPRDERGRFTFKHGAAIAGAAIAAGTAGYLIGRGKIPNAVVTSQLLSASRKLASGLGQNVRRQMRSVGRQAVKDWKKLPLPKKIAYLGVGALALKQFGDVVGSLAEAYRNAKIDVGFKDYGIDVSVKTKLKDVEQEIYGYNTSTGFRIPRLSSETREIGGIAQTSSGTLRPVDTASTEGLKDNQGKPYNLFETFGMKHATAPNPIGDRTMRYLQGQLSAENPANYKEMPNLRYEQMVNVLEGKDLEGAPLPNLAHTTRTQKTKILADLYFAGRQAPMNAEEFRSKISNHIESRQRQGGFYSTQEKRALLSLIGMHPYFFENSPLRSQLTQKAQGIPVNPPAKPKTAETKAPKAEAPKAVQTKPEEIRERFQAQQEQRTVDKFRAADEAAIRYAEKAAKKNLEDLMDLSDDDIAEAVRHERRFYRYFGDFNLKKADGRPIDRDKDGKVYDGTKREQPAPQSSVVGQVKRHAAGAAGALAAETGAHVAMMAADRILGGYGPILRAGTKLTAATLGGTAAGAAVGAVAPGDDAEEEESHRVLLGRLIGGVVGGYAGGAVGGAAGAAGGPAAFVGAIAGRGIGAYAGAEAGAAIARFLDLYGPDVKQRASHRYV